MLFRSVGREQRADSATGATSVVDEVTVMIADHAAATDSVVDQWVTGAADHAVVVDSQSSNTVDNERRTDTATVTDAELDT